MMSIERYLKEVTRRTGDPRPLFEVRMHSDGLVAITSFRIGGAEFMVRVRFGTTDYLAHHKSAADDLVFAESLEAIQTEIIISLTRLSNEHLEEGSDD